MIKKLIEIVTIVLFVVFMAVTFYFSIRSLYEIDEYVDETTETQTKKK